MYYINWKKGEPIETLIRGFTDSNHKTIRIALPEKKAKSYAKFGFFVVLNIIT